MINSGKINGYDYEIDENRIVWFKADQMAEKLGITRVRNDRKYNKSGHIMWNRFNNFIEDIARRTSAPGNAIVDCGNKGYTQIPFPVKKGDYIPYHLVLRIAMRLNNDTAREFQIELINIVDSINENGIYTNNDLINLGTKAIHNNNDENLRTVLNNDMRMYARQKGISMGQAYNEFYDRFDRENNMRVNVRANNYARKNNIKNYSTPKFMEDNGMMGNAGNTVYNMAYDSYSLQKFGVPKVVVNINSNQEEDDGYYHPALKPVVSVTAVINGKKKTSTTFIDKDGNTFFQNREE